MEFYEVYEPLDCLIISIHLVKVYVSPFLLLMFYLKHTAGFSSLELEKVIAPCAFNDLRMVLLFYDCFQWN